MDDKNFRLSPDVRPERYTLRVAPDLESRSFHGSGQIELSLAAPASELTLHAAFLEQIEAALELGGERLVPKVELRPVSETAVFRFSREIPAGSHRLDLSWRGKMHGDLRGMYVAGGVIVTQLEAADARRVFPCFDEPSFKAVWDLALEVPEGKAALSNGKIVAEEALENGKRLVRFAPTPTMSSYLVALIVGDLVSSEPRTVQGVEIRTWAVPRKQHLSHFGQNCASAVLPLLEEYFDVPYAFGKLDQVGIPDFEAGAMENSGCVTFREVALLLDEERAPLGIRKRVAEIITHELAHMWFGNLVTMSWWDDLWLNEAFATWMAFKIVDVWKPEWRMWDDFDSGKAQALQLDSLASTHPIHVPVRNAYEATENFDLITYEKGGALLRMFEGFLGEAAFRDGIRSYMKKHAYKNTVADDLWDALSSHASEELRPVAQHWIGCEGYPLVSLEREENRISLAQRRYFRDPELFEKAEAAVWPIPMVFSWADDKGAHKTRFLFKDPEGELSLPASGEIKYVCANSEGSGFYRVAYSSKELACLALHRGKLSPVERASLVSDSWALFKAGSGTLGAVLDLVQVLGSDSDYVVLGEMVAVLAETERLISNRTSRAVFRRMVSRLLWPQIEELGWEAGADESDDQRLRRAVLVRALALVARRFEAVSEVSERLERLYQGDENALGPDLLDAASVAAAREGDEGLFNTFVERLESPDPATARRALVALASFEQGELPKRSIDLFLSEQVPQQDSSTYLAALLANPAARSDAWNMIREKWPQVRQKVAAPMLLRRVVESFKELVRERDEVEAFFAENAADFATVSAAVRQTQERLRLDEELRRRGHPELVLWLSRGKEI